MATIALLSCSKSKLPYKSKAKDLYSPSPWFRKAYDYAKQSEVDKIFILSTLYGLVPENKEIEPYEATLNNAFESERKAWADRIIVDLCKVADLENDTFVIIAGKRYYEYLLPHLKHVQLPLKGLSLGYWVPTLNQMLGESQGSLKEVKSVSYELHQLFNSLLRVQHPFKQAQIPMNGIYIMFEEGEKYQGMDRIVRVGINISQNRLRGRIRDHFFENKDKSIFRKNIGQAILNRDNDEYLNIWSYNPKMKDPPILEKADPDYQFMIEKRVSEYIRKSISFVFIPVEAKSDRLRFENAIVATLNKDPLFNPGITWLGRHSPKPEIRTSGLWLVQGLNGLPITAKEFEHIKKMSGIKMEYNSPPIIKSVSLLTERTFAEELNKILEQASHQGKEYADVISGDLHRLVGGYPGANHRMPTCCKVMYSYRKDTDEVLYAPPSGKGATLKIRYWL